MGKREVVSEAHSIFDKTTQHLQVLHIADEVINEILLIWGWFQKKFKECVADKNELMYIDMRI